MQRNTYKTKWNTYTIVAIGVLIAMTLVLTRMLAIPVGNFGRFTLGSVCTIMAGLWFGPLAGAVSGFCADILGCLMQGYAVNPLITVGAMMWGIIPALMKPLAMKEGKGKGYKIGLFSLSIVITAVIASLGFTYAGLVLILGMNFYAILPTRLVQFAAMTPVYCVLVCSLYFSPVTALVQKAQLKQMGRHAVNTTER